MRAEKKDRIAFAKCCIGEDGRKRPFHLCCKRCRERMAVQERAGLLAGSTAPERCSAEILPAPPRGRVAEFRETRILPQGDDFRVVEAPYKAGYAGRCRDVFDVMTDYLTRRGGEPPFTLAQVDAGRAYRALHERVASAGVKCSGAFQVERSGRSGKVDFMDAYIRDVERLDDLRNAIGAGVAKETRERREATAGKVRIGDVELRRIGRKLITVRALVDAVCLSERSLSAVLEAHGWRATGKNRKALLASLRAALERMRGI